MRIAGTSRERSSTQQGSISDSPAGEQPPTKQASPPADAPRPPASRKKEATEDLDPTLPQRLTIVTQRPAGLDRAPFASARAIFADITTGVRDGTLSELKRMACPSDHSGSSSTDGRALVVDSKARARALADLGGTGDHYHEIRYFLDARERLRLIIADYRDVHMHVQRDVVAFDEDGRVSGCIVIADDGGVPGWDLCIDEDPEPELDPDVREALGPREPHVPKNRVRETLQENDVRDLFEECEKTRRR